MKHVLGIILLILLSEGCRHVCTIKTAPAIQSHPEVGPLTVPLDETDWLWA